MAIQVYYNKKSLAAKASAFITWSSNTACRGWEYIAWYDAVSEKIDPGVSLIFIGECFSPLKRRRLAESEQGFLQIMPAATAGHPDHLTLWNWLRNTGRIGRNIQPPRLLSLAQEIDGGADSPLHQAVGTYLESLSDPFEKWPSIQHMTDTEILRTIESIDEKKSSARQKTAHLHDFKTTEEIDAAEAKRKVSKKTAKKK